MVKSYKSLLDDKKTLCYTKVVVLCLEIYKRTQPNSKQKARVSKMKLKRVIAGFLSMIMVLTLIFQNVTMPVFAVTTDEIKENTNYVIVSKKNGKAMTVESYATGNGAVICQETLNNYESQVWTFDKTDDGYYVIVNYKSGKAIDVPWASTDAGVQVEQFDKNNGDNQKWKITDVGDGYCRISPKLAEDLALNVEGNSDNDGAGIIQWGYSGANNELWEIREVDEVVANPELEDPDVRLAVDKYLEKFFYIENGLGKLRNEPSNGFWTDAEILEVFIDAYEQLGDEKYKTNIKAFYDGIIDRRGKSWAWNGFNDDVMWMVIACARSYILTGDQEYLDSAIDNFNMCYDRSWDESFLGGGLWWTTDNNTKNACVNGPGAIAACLLGQATGDESYYTKAKAMIDWEYDNLFNTNTGAVSDSIRPVNANDKDEDGDGLIDNDKDGDGIVISTWASTYNQGTFIGACTMLYKHYNDQKYFNAANLAAKYSSGMGDGNEGYLNREQNSGDLIGFKGILGRWLGYFIRETGVTDYNDWMYRNSVAAWNNRNSDDLMWTTFGRRTPENIEVRDANEVIDGTTTPKSEYAAWGCSAAVAWLLGGPQPETNENYELYSLEGEEGSLLNGATPVDADNCSNKAYAGNIGGAADGAAEFTIYSDSDSARKIYIYYATATQRSLSVEVNGNAQTVVCGATGGWGVPNTNAVEITVNLKQGTNVIRFVGVDGAAGPNLDRFQIQLTSDEITQTDKIKNSKIRISCIGDSTTDGIGASNGAGTYPSQLQSMLGTTEYIVGEYGESGAFVCESEELCWNPYIIGNEYKQSLESNPDIVLIMMGTNDASENMCWGKIDQGVDVQSAFRQGYENLINTYLNLESKPRIILATPLTSVNSENREENNINGTIPIIKELAEKYDLTLLDLHSYTANWTNDNYLSDGLHPNDAGYTVIAEQFSAAVKNEAGALSEIKIDGAKLDEFDTNKIEYEVEYIGKIPQVEATVSNAKVNATVVQASDNNKTATIEITTAAGSLLKTYTINFKNVSNLTTFAMEAEDAELSGGAGSVTAEACSNGKYVGGVGGGNGVVTFNLNAATAGQKELRVYYATWSERQVSVTVNGNAVGNLTCPGTGDWGIPSVEPQTINVTLNEGVNTIQLSGVDNAYAPNIDKIEIVGVGAITVVEEEPTTEAPTTEESTTEEPTTEPPTTEPLKPIEVIGAVVNEISGNRVVFAWGQTEEQVASGQQYNVYIDGQLYTTTTGATTLDYTFADAGAHKIVIKALLNGMESEGVTLDVNIESQEEPAVEINGYQISTVQEGFRVVYSVSDTGNKVESVGMVYGLTDYVTEDEMVVGSQNSTVFAYQATEAGKMDSTVSEMEDAESYTMTMKFNTQNPTFFSTDISVRAYVKLIDGTYIYSDVENSSVYDIADDLYTNLKMNTLDAHNYLYNNILTLVKPDYNEVDFNWNNTVVEA